MDRSAKAAYREARNALRSYGEKQFVKALRDHADARAESLRKRDPRLPGPPPPMDDPEYWASMAEDVDLLLRKYFE